MKRYVTMEEISDGKLYKANDMVKADCGGCQGCSACCGGMGNSVVLDPLDVHRLTAGLGRSFPELLQEELEISLVDGLTLPNLKMAGETERCSFLNEEGRCRIHAFRPGICRLFPLGRYYEEEQFWYFLQIHECPRAGRTKVKVKNWIDTPDLKFYEAFVWDWHRFLKSLGEQIEESGDRDFARNMNLYMLNAFYMRPYGADFYKEFRERLEEAQENLGI